MFFHLLRKSIRRRWSRIVLALLAVVMGASVASALITVALDINEKMGREFRAYGANILLIPENSTLPLEIGGVDYSVKKEKYLDERELYRIKTIFWRHNILGYVPYLSGTVEVSGSKTVLTGTYFDEGVEVPALGRAWFGDRRVEEAGATFTTGAKRVFPWWKVEGRWPAPGEALVGASVADALGLRIGEAFRASYEGREEYFTTAGILTTGGGEEGQIFVHLGEAQRLFGRDGGVDKVLVSALTTPEKGEVDPKRLSPEEYEVWYCTPYISSIILQLGEALPGAEARPIRQVAENEGRLLLKFEGMLFLITSVALAASALGVMAAMTTSIFERQREVGLMKALGADEGQIYQLFFAEAGAVGLVGGAIGAFFGLLLAGAIGSRVFGTPVGTSPLALGVTLALSTLVAFLGCLSPVRRAAKVEPALVMRGD